MKRLIIAQDGALLRRGPEGLLSLQEELSTPPKLYICHPLEQGL